MPNTIPHDGFPIAPGTTWFDETGREWTAFGSLVLRDDLVQTTRQNLAAYLESVYLDAVNVYAYPADVIAVPAIVIAPGDPYIAPYDQGGPEHVIWNFEVTIITSRVSPVMDEHLARLEYMFAQLQSVITGDPANGISGFPQARWQELGSPQTFEVGDIPYLGATMVLFVADKLQKV